MGDRLGVARDGTRYKTADIIARDIFATRKINLRNKSVWLVLPSFGHMGRDVLRSRGLLRPPCGSKSNLDWSLLMHVLIKAK